MENKIISKSWMTRHIIISSFMSVLALVFFANESSYNSYEEEGIIGFVCTAAIYWFLVLIFFAIIKAYRTKIYSKGWLRLHVIMIFLGGGIFCFFYSFLIWDFDEDSIWALWFLWPIFYLLWMLMNSGIIINNKNVVSKIWLKIHYAIACIISIVHMIYRHKEDWDEYEVAMFGALTFLLYYLILFSTVWILSGFKESESLKQ